MVRHRRGTVATLVELHAHSATLCWCCTLTVLVFRLYFLAATLVQHWHHSNTSLALDWCCKCTATPLVQHWYYPGDVLVLYKYSASATLALQWSRRMVAGLRAPPCMPLRPPCGLRSPATARGSHRGCLSVGGEVDLCHASLASLGTNSTTIRVGVTLTVVWRCVAILGRFGRARPEFGQVFLGSIEIIPPIVFQLGQFRGGAVNCAVFLILH